jgi:multidrug efflux pump subunit AcrA (membrane-fusion protein)
MTTGLFREKALAKLRSPERLDTLFTVTTPAGWVGLAAVLLLVISGLVWSVFGTIAYKVGGVGIIVDSAGTASVAPLAGGRVRELRIEEGQRVSKGQIVAVIEQPDVIQDIVRSRSDLDTALSRTDTVARVASIKALYEKLAEESQVVSPYDGIVTAKNVKQGDIVPAGAAIFSLRLDQARSDVTALLYVPALEGKRVQPGMLVQISPGSVDSTEYGTMVGRVVRVSEYPVSAASIQNWVGNKDTANWIIQSGGGSVMEVRADLIKDADTPSGYLWSSIVGAPLPITPGTACTGSVVVNRQAPITKGFRKLNQWLQRD